MKMKKLPTLAAYAMIAPALTLGFGSAFATDPPAGLPDTKEQRSTYEQRTSKEEYSQEQRQMPSQAQQGQNQTPQQAQKDLGKASADRAQEHRMSADRAQQQMQSHGTFMASAPANSFRAEQLIGADLKSRSDDETIGSINDLIIDEDGQIVAVIVEAGGFLGLGKKDVAVSWDSIEHRSNDDNDGYDFSVNTTKDALTNAAEYKSSDETGKAGKSTTKNY